MKNLELLGLSHAVVNRWYYKPMLVDQSENNEIKVQPGVFVAFKIQTMGICR